MEPLALRGTIEGFYGPPWTAAQRRDHLRFSADVGLNAYVYAPKDDPYHRRLWREPYPAELLGELATLVSVAAGLGVRFVYALHPALSMRYAEDTEHDLLVAKARQLQSIGVQEFALLFDDVPLSAGLGTAHGEAVARFAATVGRPVFVCPTDYAGIEASPYRTDLAASLPADVLVAWTGRDVVVGSVTRAEIDAAAASYQRPLVLWDNFPVNDFEPSRLFLGPLTGRPASVAGSALVGVIANAMIEAEPRSEGAYV